MSPGRCVLLTGFPTFLSRHVVRALLADGFTGKLLLLHPAKVARAAQKVAEALPAKRGATVQLIEGDVLDMHFGLPGQSFRALADTVSEVIHLAEVSHPSASEQLLRRVNVDGTRNLLDVLRELPLVKRLIYLSTAFVSGDREGMIAEDEGDLGQRVLDAYAASKLDAERMLKRVPERIGVTCVRPSFVVGHSETGEVDRLEGPLYFALRLGLSAVPVIPISGGSGQPLHAVPVDFVARAIALASRTPKAAGRTLHLVDPNPLSARRVYELVARLMEKRVQVLPVSREATDAVLRIPLVETLFRPQRRGLGQAGQMVFYSGEGLVELFGGELTCPPLRSYMPKLLEGARQLMSQKREASVLDSLDDSAVYEPTA